jgi:hypothetical protein
MHYCYDNCYIVLRSSYGWKTDGTLDEYRMYNRALSEAEVRQVYEYVPPDC